ncbi:6527_t:CDS:2, partial [Ambispora gerdemannii]
KALLTMYMSFDIPENVKNQLYIGKLTGEQFEDALFNRLAVVSTDIPDLITCWTYISISDFQIHHRTSAKDIKNAFVKPIPKLPVCLISKRPDRDLLGSGHAANINPTTNEFVVTRNSRVD